MLTSRVCVAALTGAAALLPLISAAQEARLPRVDISTPVSEVSKYALTARVREIRLLTLKTFWSTMGAHVDLPKRSTFKADYYDAWRARLMDRAYPNDTIDTDAYARAVERRLQMAPAPALGARSAPAGDGLRQMAAAAPNPTWQLVGPTRTSVPYVIYYGPANSYVSGRVGGIAFHPTDSRTVYMTGSAGGVFKTTNGGTNWTNLSNGILSPYMGAIAVSPTNPNLVIAGAGDFDGGNGVASGMYRSTDAGATWTSIARAQMPNVRFSSIIFDKNTPTRVLATAGRGSATSNGLWQSLDSGVTWTKISVAGNASLSLDGVSAGPAGTTMVAASEYPAKLFFSTNSGSTWSEITNYTGAGANARNVAAASQLDANVVYAAEDANQAVYKGTLSGGTWTWTNITGNMPNGYNWSQSSYDMHIASSKHTVNGTARDTVYVGLITVASYDGSTWTDIGATYTGNAKSHNDQHNFAVFPGDSTKMAIGNDGGIYGLTIAANGAHTIDARMNGDSTMAMFYSGAWHPTNPTKMFGGTQDNASPTSIGDIANWANRTGGDGTDAAIDRQTPDRQYGSAQFLSMYRTVNAWNTQSGFRGNFPDPNGLPFIGRFSTDKSPEGMLYVGGNSQLYRYNASTNSWTDFLGSQTFTGAIRAIAAAPSDPQTVYVGTSAGRIYVTFNRGTNWTQLESGGSLGAITSFAVHPTKPWDVLLSTGSTSTHVYRYADSRLATPVRTAVSGAGGGALPNIFSSSVARHQTRPDSDWYVSTDVGVFGTTNGGNTWFNMTEPLGLPPVEGATLEHTVGTGYLNLATYGRGMWRLRLEDVVSPASFVITGTVRRTAYNVIAVTLNLNNTGGSNATVTKIQSANMVLGRTGLRPFTPLPLNVGTVVKNTTSQATITYQDRFLTQSGLQGTVNVEVSYRSGTENLSITVPIAVTLP